MTKADNGWYWANTAIQHPEKGQVGKMVGAEPTADEDIFILHGNRQYDDTWEANPEKGGWFTKEVLVNELEFFNFPVRQ